MRTVFADTFYWIALADPRDDWHDRVLEYSRRNLPNVRLLTTDEVLTEFMTFFRDTGAAGRTEAVRFVDSIRRNPNVQVVPQTRESFDAAQKLYAQRIDKEYSLTDCSSMQTMRNLGLNEVLTHDPHFQQEGFAILFP
jgi:predicted nucleic acid-binding protein